MPFVQVGVGGIALGGKTALPLYDAMSDLDMLQSMASKVEASPARRIADALLSRYGRNASQVSDYVAELRSTAQDIQDVREEAEIDTIASVVKISRNVLLGVLVLLAWLVLQSISQRTPHMRRAVATAIFMTLVGIFTTVLFFGAGEGLALANEEIGLDILSLASGAYMMLVAALIGTGTAIAAAILEGRSLSS